MERITIRENDPEVAADLRRRDDSEREHSRAREARNPFATPDPIVEHWSCRCGCGAMHPVTAADVENLAIANRKLVARRERPIGKHEVMWCPSGRAAYHQSRAAIEAAPRQTEITTTTTNELARYLPTPRKGKRRLRP